MTETTFTMTETAINPLKAAKDDIGFVTEFLVLAAGSVVTEEVKAKVGDMLKTLAETTPDLSMVVAIEAFERVPDLREFAAQLRSAALPGTGYKKIFDKSEDAFFDANPREFQVDHLSLEERGVLLEFLATKKQ